MQEHDIEQLRDEHKSATEVTMPTDVKQRIYQMIGDNNTAAVKRRTNRRQTYWASGAAAVAAIAIVVGGFAAYSNQANVAKSPMGSHQKGTSQKVTTADNHQQPSAYNPPTQDAAYVQIGNLKLGQNFAEVQKLYGKPTTKTTAHGEGGPEWIYSKLGLNLGGDPLWKITVSDPFKGALPSGIHIGSSEHEVQKAYPHATVHHLSGETSVTEQSSDKQYNLYITLSNGKVSSIIIEASTPSPPVNSGFSICRNTMYKFSFQYPQNWKLLTPAMDGGGTTFIFNTKLNNFTNQGAGILHVPKNDAVINAVGVYNVANQTYANIKNKPSDPSIISYQVTKYADGYEVNEVQRKGTALWFTVKFLDKTYVKTLQVIVPDQANYKQLATEVVKSYNPIS